MNKVQGSCTKRFVSILVCLASLLGSQAVLATVAKPPGCVNVASIGMDTFCRTNADGSVDLSSQITGGNVVPGQTIFYQAFLQRSAGQCCASNGAVRVVTPDGVSHNVGTVTELCSAADGGAGIQNFAVVPYTVRTQDMGVLRSFNQVPCDPLGSISVQSSVIYTGGINECNGTCSATASTDNCNPVFIPHLTITKLVSCSTGQVCDATLPYGSSASGAQFGNTNPSFCYSITITNDGTAGLAITNVFDDNLGDLTSQFPGGLLANSGTTVFVGPIEHASTVTDHITARGFEVESCIAQAVSGPSSATANVIQSGISCDIRFIQNGTLQTGNVCNDATCNADVGILPSANSVTVVVRVTNTAGNGQNIVNGTIKVGANSFSVAGPIAPGNFVDTTVDTVSGSDLVCNGYTADVVFEGATTDSCPPIPTSCSKKLQICGSPKVCIVKLVKCVTDSTAEGECETGICSTDLSLYAPSATGVENAGFCYGIIIQNCGDIALTNVTVVDNQLGNSLGFPTTLAAGQSATNFYQKSYPNFVGTVRNTATVSGQGGGSSVSANTNAVVTLLQPSIMCEKTVSINGGAPNAGGTITVTSGSSNDLTFAVTVKNNGDVDLQNVQVIDTGTSGCPASTNVIDFLAVNDSTNITLCTIFAVTCPPTTTISNIVNVSAEVSSNVCSISPENCQRITTSSSCNNTITLVCSTPGCRTTGGGKQLTSEHQVCPIHDPAFAKDVRYVTHGGQVGAPFGASSAPTITDCSTGAGSGFNNPCIRGEYQHVRHMQGGLRGNFHAASNGNEHDFDSLMCACLMCTNDAVLTPSLFGGCHPADRTYQGDGTEIEGLCNPDRMPNCGPEPRPAPANKIAFSGVADYAATHGKKAPLSVVFRVDIEDRGEPGNAHVTTKSKKILEPDRYRMRMWFITGDPDSAFNRRLREAVAVKDAHDERVGTAFGGFQVGLMCDGTSIPEPDIDDGGDLDRGNRQIHPNTGATCND